MFLHDRNHFARNSKTILKPTAGNKLVVKIILWENGSFSYLTNESQSFQVTKFSTNEGNFGNLDIWKFRNQDLFT
jgi:hypothetical protein